MAYAYPATVDLTPGTTGSATGGTVGPGERRGRFDVLKEFKYKIDEDDHYISFFLERIRVEETYIENLTRLYDRTVAVDSLHDDVPHRGPKSTSRRAWQEVRDYTQREIESRQAMISALREDVVNRLVAVKDTQSRIRQRIREDMKHSNETYDEYAGSKLPKLKRAYIQKSQVVEDIRRQEHAIAMQARLLSDPSPTSPSGSPLHEHPNPIHALSPQSQTSSLPTSSSQHNLDLQSTAPIPAQSSVTFSATSQSPPSITTTKGRHRASSASMLYSSENRPKDVLNDIAHQSKKGFNAFMQRLGGDKGDKDEGGFGGDEGPISGHGGGLVRRGTGGKDKGGSAMKGVRAKREADDADKAYRYGVFHLESLRIRRDKLQSSAVTSLEQFNEELNTTLRATLERYIDTLHGTAATNAQATEVARSAIETINLDRDMSIFRTKIPSATASQTAPVLYENFHVGPCRSLIFGVSLTDYDFARGEGGDHGRPPAIVEKCLAAIDQRGLDSEGIYRISGRHAGVQETVQRIEVDEEKFVFEEKDDVFSISNVLKQYLRQLPEPVFPLPHAERVKHTENRESHIHSNFSALRGRLRRLAPIHQTTFQAIIEHLGRVQMHSAANKMDAKNLAVVFNTALFGPDQLPSDGNVLTMHLEKDTVLEDLITFSDLLFGDESPALAPTVLPPGSALSRSGVLTYNAPEDGAQPGSSRTKIRILDPAPVEGSIASPSGSTSNPTSSVPPAVQPEPTPAKGTEGKVGTANESKSSSSDLKGLGSILPEIRFTPDNGLELLFDPVLIPQSLRDSLGDDLHIRPLSSTDFLRSHFPLLSTLSPSPALSPSTYKSLFTHLLTPKGTYYILTIIQKSTDELVASATLIVERKFIHGAGLAGHIEDVVVGKGMQGRGLGVVLVRGLKELAERLGCYKIILDCKEGKVGFYQKCGFELRGRQMAYYVPLPENQSTLSLSAFPTVPTTYPTPGTIPPSLPPRPNPDLQSDRALQNPKEEEESEVGSPKTFRSASSGGVTYSYPLDDHPPTGGVGALGSGMPALAVVLPSANVGGGGGDTRGVEEIKKKREAEREGLQSEEMDDKVGRVIVEPGIGVISPVEKGKGKIDLLG